ncbi:hypothetical protein SAMN05444146_1936 [Flavobacterium johnsoniae]|nr:hypothetical protein SAMN05444146_1936 [Flavobacterium johnsoniae]
MPKHFRVTKYIDYQYNKKDNSISIYKSLSK